MVQIYVILRFLSILHSLCKWAQTSTQRLNHFHKKINNSRITKLDKEKNQCIREKNGSREYSKGNKTVQGKVATTHTEDGHKQDTSTSITI